MCWAIRMCRMTMLSEVTAFQMSVALLMVVAPGTHPLAATVGSLRKSQPYGVGGCLESPPLSLYTFELQHAAVQPGLLEWGWGKTREWEVFILHRYTPPPPGLPDFLYFGTALCQLSMSFIVQPKKEGWRLRIQNWNLNLGLL